MLRTKREESLFQRLDRMEEEAISVKLSAKRANTLLEDAERAATLFNITQGTEPNPDPDAPEATSGSGSSGSGSGGEGGEGVGAMTITRLVKEVLSLKKALVATEVS